MRTTTRPRPAARRRPMTTPTESTRRRLIATLAVIAALIGLLVIAGHAGTPAPAPATAQAHVVYQARTSTDGPLNLPVDVTATLTRIGKHDGSILLTRIDGATSTTTTLDLTPRTAGHETRDTGRRASQIQATLSALTDTMNTPAATGGRALYSGLRTTRFTEGIPVIILGNELDLTDPVDTRKLAFTVTIKDAVTALGTNLPALHDAPVTFVPTPTTAPQDELGPDQSDYLDQLWTGILTSAGASHVTITRADTTSPPPAANAGGRPDSATVPVPALPGTAIPPGHHPDGSTTCTIPGTRFAFDQATLADPDQTANDLKDCVTQALTAGATLTIDAYASYEGPVTPNGQPATHNPHNQTLSQARANTLAALLIHQLGVDPTRIGHVTGHGDHNLPDPTDPASPANRIAVITTSAT